MKVKKGFSKNQTNKKDKPEPIKILSQLYIFFVMKNMTNTFVIYYQNYLILIWK